MVQFAQGQIAVNFGFAIRDRMPQQLFKVCIGNVQHIALIIAIQVHIFIRMHGSRSMHGDFLAQPDVLHACADKQLVLAALDFPAVSLDIPETERLIVQRNGDALFLAGGERYAGKAFQFLCRAEKLTVLFSNIQLHNFRSCHAAGVRYGKADPLFIGSHIAVRKRRVAHTIAKREAHSFFRRGKVAVADVQPFAVLHGLAAGGKVGGAGDVGVGQRPCFCQLAAGIDLAGQRIRNGARPRLTA